MFLLCFSSAWTRNIVIIKVVFAVAGSAVALDGHTRVVPEEANDIATKLMIQYLSKESDILLLVTL